MTNSNLKNDIARTYELGNVSEYPVVGEALIFEGSAVGINEAGYAGAFTTGNKFAGFADENVDNLLGTDGDKIIRTKVKGAIVLPAPSGITLASVGSDIYVSGENTFTTTSTNNAYIGKIRRVSNSEITVDFQAFVEPKATA